MEFVIKLEIKYKINNKNTECGYQYHILRGNLIFPFGRMEQIFSSYSVTHIRFKKEEEERLRIIKSPGRFLVSLVSLVI